MGMRAVRPLCPPWGFSLLSHTFVLFESNVLKAVQNVTCQVYSSPQRERHFSEFRHTARRSSPDPLMLACPTQALKKRSPLPSLASAGLLSMSFTSCRVS